MTINSSIKYKINKWHHVKSILCQENFRKEKKKFAIISLSIFICNVSKEKQTYFHGKTFDYCYYMIPWRVENQRRYVFQWILNFCLFANCYLIMIYYNYELLLLLDKQDWVYSMTLETLEVHFINQQNLFKSK